MKKSRWTPGRVIVVLVGVVLAVNVSLAGFEKIFGGSRGGPASSSYTTSGDGLAAYADLLSRNHEVVRSRVELSKLPLDPRSTLVVLAANDIKDADIAALRTFVTSGGRLVAGGAPATWLNNLVPGVSWKPLSSQRSVAIVDVPETSGVRVVDASGIVAFDRTGTALPIVGTSSTTLAAVTEIGTGRVVLLADASFLDNAHLATFDNAAFGVSMIGANRQIVFAESVHGYGSDQGFGAIPDRVRWFLYGLALAAIVGMISRGRRLGPPLEPSRELPPPRRAYVDSLSSTLRTTTGREAAIVPLLNDARERLARMTGVRLDDPVAVVAAAKRVGLSDEEAQALIRVPSNDDDVVGIGRASAKLSTPVLYRKGRP